MAAPFEENESSLNLGFLERSESWILASRFFRSKMGGKPAWLDLENLPKKSETVCPKCEDPLAFLCQIYCPIEDQSDCFHRVLFTFVCKSPKCQTFKVFRCQLPRKNPFYPHEPPVENPTWKPELTAEKYGRVCRACGVAVDGVGGKCGSCKKVDYCHRSHQVADWKHRHKVECKDPAFDPGVAPDDPEKLRLGLLFPEYEIVMAGDDESDVSDDSDDEEEEGGDGDLEAFKQLEREGKTGQLSGQDLAQYVNESAKEDKLLKLFKKTVKSAPDQVIRYDRVAAKPLWVSSSGQPSEIPPCPYCGAQRRFEFQIMPQMLNYLELDGGLDQDSVDWGVLAVYTCQNSCNAPDTPAYKTEHIWRQPMS